MRNLRRAAVLGSSVLLAAGSGYIMQNSDSLGQRPDLAQSRVAAAAPVRMDEIRNIQSVASIPAVVRSSLAEGPLTLPIIAVRDVSETRAVSKMPFETSEPGGFGVAQGSACEPGALALSDAAHGLVRVELMAPCHPQEEVRVSDGALEFDILTDADGQWAGVVPAYEQNIDIKVYFADNEASEATLRLDAVPAFKVLALNWVGADALRLNAFEFGSDAGGAGHVSSTLPRTPDTLLGGYILVLGEVYGGALAEVYIAPHEMEDTQFDLEALVTEESCDTDLAGKLIRSGARGLEVTALSFAMPECDAVGSSLLMELPETPLELASAD